MAKPSGRWGDGQWGQSAWHYTTGPSHPPGHWGEPAWGRSSWWQPTPPPGGEGGWGSDWRFWYQVGGTVTQELTNLVVEARWTSDAHTLGDGTFRGDCQPGKLTMRMWDPGRIMDHVDPLGAVWACYVPNGNTWCWFYDSVTRGLYETSPDPDSTESRFSADCVYTGVSWAYRLMAPTTTARAAESIHSRLVWVGDQLNAHAAAMKLPTIIKDLDGQSQQMAALTADTTTGYYESYLQMVRDASVYGWGDLEANGAATGAGTLSLTYRRWENTLERVLDQSQVVAGPPVEVGVDLVLNTFTWKGTDATLTAATDLPVTNPTSSATTWGIQAVTPRAWDVTVGAVATALRSTASNLMSIRNNPPASGYLSTVSCQSGDRWMSDGRPSPIPWDPRAHVFAPTDIVDYVPTGTTAHSQYRVTKSDHTLNATVWQTTHTLELFHPATALPA